MTVRGPERRGFFAGESDRAPYPPD